MYISFLIYKYNLLLLVWIDFVVELIQPVDPVLCKGQDRHLLRLGIVGKHRVHLFLDEVDKGEITPDEEIVAKVKLLTTNL